MTSPPQPQPQPFNPRTSTRRQALQRWLGRKWPVVLLGLVALGLIGFKVWDRVHNPWTRDGQVRATVVEITTRVSGPIIKLPIRNNQAVRKGDLLFEIDPRTFTAKLEQSKAGLDNTRDDIEALAREVDVATANVRQAESVVIKQKSALQGDLADLKEKEADFRRAQTLVSSGALARQRFDAQSTAYRVAQAQVAEARASVLQAEKELLQAQASEKQAVAKLGAPGNQNAQLRAAKAALRDAELNLEFTRVVAPVDGYVTNLNLRLGSQAVANQPVLALLDRNSFRIDAYFRETWVGRIQPGDQAVVTLMGYPNQPLKGRVDSIGWGIAQDNGSTGEFLLPNVNPTFEWIRLAQRIPVHIELEQLPSNVILRLGSTASVLVKTNSAPKAPSQKAATASGS